MPADRFDPPLRILAAGSLRPALRAVMDMWRATHGISTTACFGPAGLLRERIEAGTPCDLFLSANLAHPRALESRLSTPPTRRFAANMLVAVVRPDMELTTGTLLATLLRPDIRIGTSTPGVDPSGDYAEAMFARAERLIAGAEASLRQRARRLVGGRVPPAVPDGESPVAWFLQRGEVAVFLTYATTVHQVAGLRIVPLPPALAIRADYGAVAISPDTQRRAGAVDLLQRLLAAPAQKILATHGFLLPADG